MPDWNELYRSLEIDRESDDELIPRPTDADIDAFEADTGILLPPSYREYSKAFGPGELAGFFRIAVPCRPEATVGRWDLRKYDIESPSHYSQEFLEEIFTETVRVKRLLYFGESVGGDFFGWDRSEVTSESPLEYAIYILGDRCQESVFLAGTFPEFIEKTCFGCQLGITLGLREYMDHGIDRSFRQFCVQGPEPETW